MSNYRARTLKLCLGLLTLWTGQATANEALQLLNSMQAAVRDLNYTGQLVYSKGDELATYRISHQAGEEEGSFIQIDANASAQADQPESFSLSQLDHIFAANETTYSFDLGAENWVANHVCRVVVARPKDKLRYLHRYCINPASGMLLKYSLMDREQTVLEQMVFTQLTILDKEPSDQLTASTLLPAVNPSPRIAMAAMVKPKTETRAAVDSSNASDLVLGHWDFQALPAGFTVVKVLPAATTATAHQVILSDGMTSVSVFIADHASSDDFDNLTYATGATHVLGHDIAGYQVTLVGEVPPATLQAIQKGLRYVAR